LAHFLKRKNSRRQQQQQIYYGGENEEGKKEAKFTMPDLFQSKNTYQRENPGHQGNSSVVLPHKTPAGE
jgi:hypothetical protein